ncbi:pentatricopeptide repeat-containing protein At1g63130, mitochondrial-like [Lycium ferocissimum]|uniref:pentatricopeptide repeat-containing protein At1g63130, mitochondrial-like n=1 Tax=Lycium ferocissimum TaxID=112874 RepID=UPI002814AD37|nr:pentatricopeptide repeat-containing protein At1g63130, mitochondrial-like [Lycium ferocissimum]
MERICLCHSHNGIIPFISSSCGSPIRSIRPYSSCHTNKSTLDAAFTLFHQMLIMKPLPSLKLGILVNGYILSSVINSYCLMHHADCGFSVLPIYLKNGIPFNIVTFTILIRGTSQQTFSLLRLMEQGNTKPQHMHLNIVIDARLQVNLNPHINSLNEMKQKGIPPDIVIYNSIINGLCKFGQCEKVKTLFSEMENLNIYPNVGTFPCDRWTCKEGKVEDAEKLIKHMIDKDVEPDLITYNVIMDGYYLHDQLDRARRVFDFMID